MDPAQLILPNANSFQLGKGVVNALAADRAGNEGHSAPRGKQKCTTGDYIMRKFINKMRRDEQGATAIEYGLIAALIAVAAISALSSLGDQVEGTFEKASTTIENANAGQG
jgi:pilus assembly protein Flp/PilA